MAILDSITQQIKVLQIESAFTPPIILEDPFAPGPPNPVMQMLKPKITLGYKSKYIKDTKLAPYGEPVPNHWPKVKVGAAIFGAGALITLIALMTRR